MCPSRSISPSRILVVEIGLRFSAGIMFMLIISSGLKPDLMRSLLILIAIFFVSSLTTIASIHLLFIVFPKGHLME